jgi:hypothetical protein
LAALALLVKRGLPQALGNDNLTPRPRIRTRRFPGWFSAERALRDYRAASFFLSATQRAASLPILELRRSRIGSALKRKRIERDSYGAKVAALAG